MSVCVCVCVCMRVCMRVCNFRKNLVTVLSTLPRGCGGQDRCMCPEGMREIKNSTIPTSQNTHTHTPLTDVRYKRRAHTAIGDGSSTWDDDLDLLKEHEVCAVSVCVFE